MLLQQLRARRGVRSIQYDEKSKRFSFNEPHPEPDPINIPVDRGSWFAFQIAFLLMSVRSAAQGCAPDRRTVELIWFPTGGGKTEAYLGLAAFTMFLRRLRNKDDAGVQVLTRYTLRLLTAQQFLRASGLICAMEALRKDNEDELGDHEFSIGMWLGGATTPNTRSDARSVLAGLNKGDRYTENQFVLDRCPWCSAQIGPIDYGQKPPKGAPFVEGYERRGDTVVLRCSDVRCRFNRGLPVYVVDEDIYEKRPTLVIGTIDKFAMLAWKPQARAIFGLGEDGNRVSSPPGLIIQDELHLISGPLGSISGLYETLVEELCTDRRGTDPVPPKIVSSTATIRRYEDQIRALYGRGDVALFPPPGLEEGDSFFARYARDSQGELLPGRVYLGVHGPGFGSVQTAEVRTFTALLQAPIPLNDEDRDPWWTLLLFFNSLRELGNTLSLFQSDIPDRFKVIRNRLGIDWKELRRLGNIKELTGRLRSDEVPRAIAALEVPCGGKGRPVDVCLASNIIEVGIDIDRLSLMSVVGQPKTTSQYIQVTGRVGRKWRERPGIVATIYSPSKPRDRSHFEKFRSYHERLYSQVEPTSVTPFSPPTLDRALHAIMAAHARFTGGEHIAERPYPFPAALLEKLRQLVLERVAFVDADEKENCDRLFSRRMSEWKRWEPSRWNADWQSSDSPLLREAGAYVPREWVQLSWPTPTSMRNVDAECEAVITTLYLRGSDQNDAKS
jgi:Helicase conserved C-terminal domain